MRIFWSVVLAGGLLLVGVDAYQSRRDAKGSEPKSLPPISQMEDGTPWPTPRPPQR